MNIVWIFVVPPGFPILQYTQVGINQENKNFSFLILQTGRLYNEKISRYKFLGLYTYHPDTWHMATGQYTPTFIQKPVANTFTP
jgi:hypothetical protein